jgi:hypothetical protein
VIRLSRDLREVGTPAPTRADEVFGKGNAQLVSARPGNEQERLALTETHRAEVTAKFAEQQENLKLLDHKINVYITSWPSIPTRRSPPTRRHCSPFSPTTRGSPPH